MKKVWILALSCLAGSLYAVEDEQAMLNKISDMAAQMGGAVLGAEKDAGENKAEETLLRKHKCYQHSPLEMPEGGKWYRTAGLGLFIHWGPASAHYGTPWVMRRPSADDPKRTRVVAKDYYAISPKKFTAKNYDPEKWMKAASRAGFRYAVLTAKHHDGYTLWPTTHSDLGVQTYLNGRDLLNPYADAVRNNGMKVGFYFSGVDWWLDRNHMNYMFGKKDPAINFEGTLVDYNSIESLPASIMEQKRKMAFEVMERYRPDLWWWDSGLPVTLEETALKYNPDMLFNNRGNCWDEPWVGNYPGSHFVTPETFRNVGWDWIKILKKRGVAWETCDPFNGGWFYNAQTRSSENVKDLADYMFMLGKVRCWGGNMLLNIAPREDGTLPESVYEAFDKMARWMNWAAVSIYDVKGTHFPEQANVPITTSMDGKIWWLHARPGQQNDSAKWGKWKWLFYEGNEPGKPIRVSDVPKIASVKLLRTGEAVDYTYENGTLIIPNPDAGPNGLHEVIEVKF